MHGAVSWRRHLRPARRANAARLALARRGAFLRPAAAAVALSGPIVTGLLAGCFPALDWREVRPAGTAVVATLPCKPHASSRTVQLAGHPVRLAMLACKADGTTWALATADVEEPARVGPALQALRESTRANLQGEVVDAAAVMVRGATPHEAQARVRVGGRKQDGSPASAQFIVFSHGTQVFQAIAVGGRWPEPAAETFFESLRVGS